MMACIFRQILTAARSLRPMSAAGLVVLLALAGPTLAAPPVGETAPPLIEIAQADTDTDADAGAGEPDPSATPDTDTDADAAASDESEGAAAEAPAGGAAAGVQEIVGQRGYANYTAGSDVASASDNINLIITIICLVFGIPIYIITVVFIVMFRRRDDRPEPEATPTHSTPLEITWSVIPLLIVIGIFVLGFRGYLDIKAPRGDYYEVSVEGYKWNWEFRYPEGVTSNELHLPVDRNIRLLITSRDVIHSVYIPAFRVKQDAVPGRFTSMWFEPIKEGKFDLYCTEYCGTSHSTMNALVVVHDEAGFQQWIREQKASPEDLLPEDVNQRLFELKLGVEPMPMAEIEKTLIEEFPDSQTRVEAYFDYVTLAEELEQKGVEDIPTAIKDQLVADYPDLATEIEKIAKSLQPLWKRGETLWAKKGCSACHTIDGQMNTGPTFKGIWGETHNFTNADPAVVDENYLRESILYPAKKVRAGYPNQMPSYSGNIKESEINALIALIKHLGEDAN